MQEFKVPELGENVSQGDVAKILVKVGDTIARDQPVLELETDKVNVEVPSPAAGVLEHIEVQQGGYLGEDDIVRLQDDFGRVEPK